MDALQKKISLEDVQIPGLPDTTAQIIAALEDDLCSVTKLEEVILKDPALTAEVLKIVNAPYYQSGRSGKSVSSVADTIMFIGMGNLVTLVSIASLTHQCASGSLDRDIIRHLLAVSSTAASLAEQTKKLRVRREVAVVAGLLHDIGILVLLDRLPGEYQALRNRVSETGVPIAVAELESLGFTHCAVGALLAERWHFPPIYRFVLEHHHDEGIPAEIKESEALCLLVRLADKLVLDAGIGSEGSREVDAEQICTILGIDRQALEDIKKQVAGMSGIEI